MNRCPSVISFSQTCCRIAQIVNCSRSIATFPSLLCKTEDSDDKIDDHSKKPIDESKTEAKKKLDDLLLIMSKITSDSKVRLPRPRQHGKAEYEERKFQLTREIEARNQEQLGYKLGKAAEKVAESLGGDPKKTEAELLDLYLASKLSNQKKTEENEEKLNLKDLLSSMKVEKETELSRADQVKFFGQKRPDRELTSKRPSRSVVLTSVDIFGEVPFNFFSADKKGERPLPPELRTWDYLHERELRLSVTHPPCNIFDQLIQWTNEGKLWRFPIDNEQDWHEERDVDFSEHVFLERHIEPWCPKNGPIRQFMELVCVGLSKNPYMSVEEKRSHISFYENYFRSKNTLLSELGIPKIPERSEQMTVE